MWGNLTVFCLFHFNIISSFWKWQMDFLGAALGISICLLSLSLDCKDATSETCLLIIRNTKTFNGSRSFIKSTFCNNFHKPVFLAHYPNCVCKACNNHQISYSNIMLRFWFYNPIISTTQIANYNEVKLIMAESFL